MFDDDDECDENLVYLPVTVGSRSSNIDNVIPSRKFIGSNKETSLGRWFYDKKTKRKTYTSLNGKLLHGKQATLQFHVDKDIKRKESSFSLRQELEDLMCRWTTPNNNDSNGEHCVIKYDLSQLECWGIPLKIVKRYENKGFKQLFQWQIDCLNTNNGSVLLNGDHLVFSAPTSGGKTMVAEMLMLRRLGLMQKTSYLSTDQTDQQKSVINESGTVFFIVPYVALVEEKSEYFRDMWEDMNISVKSFHGDEGSSSYAAGVCDITPDIDIAVCTIERANILLNQLFEFKQEHLLSMIVIDEVHMVSDTQRGFLLEVILSKVKYVYKDSVQIVCMSATLPNIQDLAIWLNANLYVTEFRPVDLKVRLVKEKTVYSCVKDIAMDIAYDSNENSKDNQLFLPSTITFFKEGHVPHSLNFLSHHSVLPISNHSSSVSMLNINNANTNNNTNTDNNSMMKPVHSLYNSLPVTQTIQHINDASNLNTLSKQRHFQPLVQLFNSTNDPDGLIALCLETVIIDKKSVLLFCPTKELCRKNSLRLSDAFNRYTNIINTNYSITSSSSTSSQLSSIQSNVHLSSYASSLPLYESNISSQSVHNPKIQQPQRQQQLLILPHDQCNPPQTSHNPSPLLIATTPSIRQGRYKIIQNLHESPAGLCPSLGKTIPYGIAYHHAGLTIEERRLIEGGFRDGFISILCATSTLAAGVNLPAHRVIIKTPYVAKDTPLTISGFRQMCGRAGRFGLDSQGEAYLIIPPEKHNNIECENLCKKLMCSDIEKLTSNIHLGAGGGLEKLLLEMICCGRLTDTRHIYQFIQCTLMSIQHPAEQIDEWTNNALSFLFQHQFLLQTTSSHSSDNSLLLRPSQLGYAATFSGISPTDTIIVYELLNLAQKRLILKTSFHLIFLVISPATCINYNKIPWDKFENIVNKLYIECPDIQDIASYIGISQAQLLKYKEKAPHFSDRSTQTMLYKRFYIAIILYRLVHEMPLNTISKDMAIERGQSQQIQKDCVIFCNMLVTFCKKLNWNLLAYALESVLNRLNFAMSDDYLPLARLGGELISIRCRALFKNGIKTPLEIVQADVDIIRDILYASMPYDSKEPLNVGKDAAQSLLFQEKRRQACHDLALKIIQRAKNHLVEEARLLRQQMMLSY